MDCINRHIDNRCRGKHYCPYSDFADRAIHCASFIPDDFDSGVKMSAMEKRAAWADVKAKGEAIVASGGVTITNDSPSEIEAIVTSYQVASDFPVHMGGPYDVILSKRSWENKGNVGGWLQGYLCSCAWGNYNGGEPGPRFQGRFCSHAYAAMVVSDARARKDFMNDRTAGLNMLGYCKECGEYANIGMETELCGNCSDKKAFNALAKAMFGEGEMAKTAEAELASFASEDTLNRIKEEMVVEQRGNISIARWNGYQAIFNTKKAEKAAAIHSSCVTLEWGNCQICIIGEEDSFDVEIDGPSGYRVFQHKDIPVMDMPSLLKEYIYGDLGDYGCDMNLEAGDHDKLDGLVSDYVNTQARMGGKMAAVSMDEMDTSNQDEYAAILTDESGGAVILRINRWDDGWDWILTDENDGLIADSDENMFDTAQDALNDFNDWTMYASKTAGVAPDELVEGEWYDTIWGSKMQYVGIWTLDDYNEYTGEPIHSEKREFRSEGGGSSYIDNEQISDFILNKSASKKAYMQPKVLDRDSDEYQRLQELCDRLNMAGSEYEFVIEDTYFDFGQDWMWTNIIAYGGFAPIQVLTPRQFEDVCESGMIDKIFNELTTGEHAETFGFKKAKKVASLPALYEWEHDEGEDFDEYYVDFERDGGYCSAILSGEEYGGSWEYSLSVRCFGDTYDGMDMWGEESKQVGFGTRMSESEAQTEIQNNESWIESTLDGILSEHSQGQDDEAYALDFVNSHGLEDMGFGMPAWGVKDRFYIQQDSYSRNWVLYVKSGETNWQGEPSEDYDASWEYVGEYPTIDEAYGAAMTKTSSKKTATRSFTYAEMKELEDEVIGKPWLNNADRLKDPSQVAFF